jgi:phosphodiesterase/alkaline phosphatase D-like protein
VFLLGVGGARGRCADVETDVEHQPEQQEYMDMEQEQPDVELQHMGEQDMELQHMEEKELEEELQAMDEEMEAAEPQRRRKKKVVDPEPLDDYPGGPHETGLL